jgi:Flp pilus assembly pilin Flp
MLKIYLAAEHRLSMLKDHIAGLKEEKSGASIAEYALLAGMIAIAAAAALTTLQPRVGGAFHDISNRL